MTEKVKLVHEPIENIKDYYTLSTELKKLGVRIYNFRKNIICQHWKNGFELEVPREDFPRKNATAEQCQSVYKQVLELLKIHDKQINFKYNW